MVVAPEDYDDVIVTVADLWAGVETTLRQGLGFGGSRQVSALASRAVSP